MHAFKSGYPNQEYLDLSKRAIRYCQGLPLALKVVGSFLTKRSVAEWERQLDKLKGIPDGSIQKKLRISFDGLPNDSTREIFLDISCFFIGMDKDYVTQILDGCGHFAVTGIRILIELCLVTVTKQNKLMMTNMLQDMGREIVLENARYFPEKFSRLWKREDVTDVLSNESGTGNIEGVALDLDQDSDPDSDLDLTRFSAQAFTNMKKLRLLHLSRVGLTGGYKDFPKKLIWLCWHYFPLESIPDDFPLQPKLVALDLQYSELKIVWKDRKLHQNLKILNLSHSRSLTKSPDFLALPNLEELILQFCWSLSEVHSSIGDLRRLYLVNLEGCDMLKILPLNFYKSESIEILLLNGCSSFEKLGENLGDMVSLRILEADKTAIRQIPSSIVKLKKFRVLSLSGCWSLIKDTIPKNLCSLEHLLLGDNEFRSLPSLAGLSKLEVLCLNACKKLLAIPDLPTNLHVLKAIDCPELKTIPDFSKMSNMRELYLCDSVELTEVPGLGKSLNSMTRIHMEGCTNLTSEFRKNILQGWTSSGYGGIYLNGIYDIPEWFEFDDDVDNIVFEVPQRIMGRDLKGLTICFVYSSDSPVLDSVCIIVRNLTKQTALNTKIASGSVKIWTESKDGYLWQGQLSNDVLRLQAGDQVSIFVRPDDVEFVRVKKTGVHLEWDKVMKENTDIADLHLYDLEKNQDFSGGVDESISRNGENKERKSKRRRRI